MTLREDAQIIMDKALAASLPDAAVEKALKNKNLAAAGLSSFPLGKLPGRWQRRRLSFGGPHFRRHCHYQIPARQRGVAAP